VPTTQVSLIRINTENIRPPRALWVPFELGRPLGVPNDAAFQKRVIMAALKLFDEEKGPVLENYPEAAPATDEPVILACPYSPPGGETSFSEIETFCREFKREMTSLRPWYDRAMKERKRTAVGVSKLSQEEIADFLCSLLTERIAQNPREDVPFDKELRYIADDLKAYYYESITAQPGADKLSGEYIENWFWNETVAAKVLQAARDICSQGEDESLKQTADRQLVPRRFSS